MYFSYSTEVVQVMRDVTHLFVDTTGHLNVSDDPVHIVFVTGSLKFQSQQLSYGTLGADTSAGTKI